MNHIRRISTVTLTMNHIRRKLTHLLSLFLHFLSVPYIHIYIYIYIYIYIFFNCQFFKYFDLNLIVGNLI